MAKLLSWNEMPQSVKDFDANISNNLDSCESKANELSVMVNEILVLLKDADTTLKEEFKDDPQCVDAEKKLFLIYSGYQVVKTSIDHDLISGIIGMGKEVKGTIDEIRKKMSEGSNWKEASEEDDGNGNKITKENDQAKIDAANSYINKMADCAVEEINAIKNAQAAVKLGISLENLKAGELGKYINFSTTFSKTSYLTNYDGISRDFDTIEDPDDIVVTPDETDEDGILDRLKKIFWKIVEEAKKGVEDYYDFVSTDHISEMYSNFKDWLSDLDITKTFPGLSGISDLYHNFTQKVSETFSVPNNVQDVFDRIVETVKENSFFDFAKEFWGGKISQVKKLGTDVVQTVGEFGSDVALNAKKLGQDVSGKATTATLKVDSVLDAVDDKIDGFKAGALQLLRDDLLGVGNGSLLTSDSDLNDLLFKKE